MQLNARSTHTDGRTNTYHGNIVTIRSNERIADRALKLALYCHVTVQCTFPYFPPDLGFNRPTEI